MKTFYLVNKGHGTGPPRAVVEDVVVRQSWQEAYDTFANDPAKRFDPEWSIVVSATCYHKAYNSAERIMLEYHCKMMQACEKQSSNQATTTKT